MREATKEERRHIDNYIESISQKAITIPDGATNGEVLEKIFPDVASMLIEYFDTRWINALYKKEGDN